MAKPAERLRRTGAGVATALARGPLAAGLVGMFERLAPWRRGCLAILTYHRVDEPDARPDLMPGLLSATPDAFADHIDTLVRHARPVSLGEVLDALEEPRRLPPRAVLVTFDDGYADFAQHAWPALRASGVPATLFVATGAAAPDAPGFWWDRVWNALRTTTLDRLPNDMGGAPLRAEADREAAMALLGATIKSLDHETAMDRVDDLVDRLGPEPPGVHGPAEPARLGWPDLRRLAAEGVTLAPHTRTHPLLDRVTTDVAIAEILASREDLEREVGPTPAVLAYPSGAHGGSAVEAARRAGMVLGVTTVRGGNDLRSADRYRLRRINICVRTRAPLVRAQVLWASTIDGRRS
jgi:peptidoglycan/xylan/chitin deacetylase (PgdA/CDA1 family)